MENSQPPSTPPLLSHPAALSAAVLWEQCEVRRQRRSGPGGQHRNKVETAVRLVHRPTGVQAEASERRSQAENRQVALRRLRLQLALEIRTERTEASLPSPQWRSRLGQGRLSLSASSDDFPTLLAEALDVLALVDWDVKHAAQRLAVTPSQLRKLLEKEPHAATLLNQQRLARGLRPLQS